MKRKRSTSMELPEECWELILNRLAIEDLKSPSLVCKQFLSITDRNRLKLSANDEVFYRDRCKTLFRALHRFPKLKQLELFDQAVMVDFNYVIPQIASSRLDLQALVLLYLRNPPSTESFRALGLNMKNLKVLRCCDFNSFRDRDLVALADALPWLEELDIHNQFIKTNTVTDAGIEAISCKLPGLRKIDISGNVACSDRSLVALSSNCVLLNEIECSFNTNITDCGIFHAILHCPRLVSLKTRLCGPTQVWPQAFGELMANSRTLRVLDISGEVVRDQFLYSIANLGLPLEKLVLRVYGNDSNFSLNGLLTLLRACPSLKHLVLEAIDFLEDSSIRDLCQYLPNVESIDLIWCKNLSMAAFFIVARECPALLEITLSLFPNSLADGFVGDMETNHQIRYVELGYMWCMNDELLKKIGLVCPNLRTLDVKECYSMTKKGIVEILKCCSKMKHLKIRKLRGQEICLKQFGTRQIKIE